MEIITTLSNQPFWLFLASVIFAAVKFYEIRLNHKRPREKRSNIKELIIKLSAELQIDKVFIIRHGKKDYSITHEYSPVGIPDIAKDWQKHPYDDYARWAMEKLNRDREIIINRQVEADHAQQLGIMEFYNVHSYFSFGLFDGRELIGSVNCYFRKEEGLTKTQLAVIRGKISTIENALKAE